MDFTKGHEAFLSHPFALALYHKKKQPNQPFVSGKHHY